MTSYASLERFAKDLEMLLDSKLDEAVLVLSVSRNHIKLLVREVADRAAEQARAADSVEHCLY
jgi:hypothetical protein